MTLESRINEDGHLEIPEGVREQLHFEPGALVQVTVEGDALLIRQRSLPRTEREIEEMRHALAHWQGTLKGSLEADGFGSVDDYMKDVRAR